VHPTPASERGCLIGPFGVVREGYQIHENHCIIHMKEK